MINQQKYFVIEQFLDKLVLSEYKNGVLLRSIKNPCMVYSKESEKDFVLHKFGEKSMCEHWLNQTKEKLQINAQSPIIQEMLQSFFIKELSLQKLNENDFDMLINNSTCVKLVLDKLAAIDV